MAIQTRNGKAFEYALAQAFYDKLRTSTNSSFLENDAFFVAKEKYNLFNEEDKDSYKLHSNFAVNLIIDLEPRLKASINSSDKLILEIASDSRGQEGDVRDLIIIRSEQNWEIGISAKNNHRALKHSRLSGRLDFGNVWLNTPCSVQYFNEITPIFDKLKDIKKSDPNTKWDVFSSKDDEVYYPILEAFKREINVLEKSKGDEFASELILYLVGNKDFYKVIKSKTKTEIQAFNLTGSLNQGLGKIKPIAKISKLNLPSKILDISYKKNKLNTLIMTFDEGWQISFRIHSASSRVEASLKFDINLISAPHTLFSNHVIVKIKNSGYV